MKTHKVSRILLFAISSIVLFTTCENWRETAGDLAGMWQMTEWRDMTTGNIKANKTDGYYFCFQLDMMKFQEAGKSEHYLSYFKHIGDSLFIEHLIYWPAEELRPITELAKYGVPASGHFHIDVLNNNNLQLSSQEGILSFRKY